MSKNVKKISKIHTNQSPTPSLLPDVQQKKKQDSQSLKTTRHTVKSNESEKSVTAAATKIKNNSSKLPAKTLENKIIQKKISGSKIDKSIKSSTVNVAAVSATAAAKLTNKNVASLRTNISMMESRNAAKLKLNTLKNSSPRSIPIKANYIPQKPVTDHNVMNTIHNVTVQSPPSKRKEIFENENIEASQPIPRDRTKTRTLEPDEILILKTNVETKSMMNTTASASNDKIIESEAIPIVSIIKDPISFEINFDKPITSKSLSSKENVTKKLSVSSNSEYEYESDFESYESDFESEHSSVTNSISKSEDQGNTSDTPSFTNDLKEYENNEMKFAQQIQPTKIEFPLNNVKKDEERKLDSGNYDLKSQLEKLEINSVDEKDSISETQIDSGFEYTNNGNNDCLNEKIQNTVVVPSPIQPPHPSQPSQTSLTNFNKRGIELMNKITLDTMTFSLFELKPIAYEYYMKCYGHMNNIQNSTQTNLESIDQETQTDTKFSNSIWTQFPPYFSTRNIFHINHQEERNGCGEFENNSNGNDPHHSDIYPLDESLNKIKKLSSSHLQNGSNIVAKKIDYERMNFFLQKSSVTISVLLNGRRKIGGKLNKSFLHQSSGFFSLNINQQLNLQTKPVTAMYSNLKIPNKLYTIHNCKNYDETSNNLICLWDLLNFNKPMKILCSWTIINCIEVQQYYPDVVIAGLNDGTLALWDLNEPTYWHHMYNDDTLFVPAHIIEPHLKGDYKNYGCVKTIKSIINEFDVIGDYNPIQICSLHEIGIITIWTILHLKSYENSSFEFNNNNNNNNNNSKKLEHQSPWSTIKLIQSHIVDLRKIDLLCKIISERPKSGYEKTRLYFENDLFNDAALKELQETKTINRRSEHIINLRFVDMEFCSGLLCIATDQNFLLIGTQSLQLNTFKKIIIDETNLLYASQLKSKDDTLLMGLSDGSIKTLNLYREKFQLDVNEDNYDNKLNRLYNNNNNKDISTLNDDNYIGKSCVIQNIIKAEKFIHHENYVSNYLDTNINDVLMNRDINNTKKLCNQNLMSERILLHGLSPYNGNCVQTILYLRQHQQLFTLSTQKQLRIFDLLTNVEQMIASETMAPISNAVLVPGINQQEYFVTLNDDGIIEIHIINRK